MIILTQGTALENIVLTLDEKKTIPSPVYIFTATHVTTKEEVTFTLPEDISSYPERFNEFEIDTAVKFLNKPEGQWMYSVTEEDSEVEVENGRLLLKKATDFTYEGYAPETTYNGYRG